MKNNEIVPFGYDDQLVRTVMIDDAPWFVAKDVCAALGLDNVGEALKKLDDDERGSIRNSDGTSPKGGNPNMNIISESGLYTLILRSNKPEAKRFRKWVTAEVLPNIRKNGVYEVSGKLTEQMEKLKNGLSEVKNAVSELKRVQNAQSGYAALPLPEDTHADILRFGGKFLEVTGKQSDYVEAKVMFKLFFRHVMTVPINSTKFFDEISYIFPEIRLDSSRKHCPVFRGCTIK